MDWMWGAGVQSVGPDSGVDGGNVSGNKTEQVGWEMGVESG